LESFIDELARSASADPLEYRRSLLQGNARMLRTLNAAADASGWGRPASAGRHRGVALMGGAWRACCAQVVELSVEPDQRIKVHKVTCAIDSGRFVNPDQVRAQVEGGIVFGLGAALRQQITLRNGEVEQSTYRDYPVTKLADMPQIETILLETPGEPVGGVGEVPVVPIAAALCNALHQATGTRVRELPVSLAGFHHR
jgi:isoquinoline 1-oxidoreductase beta subunit